VSNLDTDFGSAMSGTWVFILAIAILSILVLFRKCIQQSERKGQIDPVTGGLNSTGLENRADRLLTAKATQYAVVVMELHNYRQLMQTFGNKETNRVLKYLHRILKNNLSNTESVARIRGGTYCFLLKNRQEEAIRVRLQRISENVNSFNQKEQVPYWIELRYGIYVPSGKEEHLCEIQEKIALMLEDSRENLNFYREEKRNLASRNWEQILLMERSFANDDFVVYMQPKVRLSDSQIAGAEASLRWRHPERGMLTSEMFRPLLEEYHLISRFDLYLFEQICRQMETWAAEGKAPCPVSVNLSHETIKQTNFLEPYIQIIKKHSIAPELIEFELSKALQQQDLTTLTKVVDEIHGYGFRCALDHFGDKTIPLQLLRELNVDTIKLDHGLFSNENNNRRNRFVVEAIIKIANQMQIRTVAEGIDNASQAQYLKQAGCDMVQGYHYFQPLTIDKFCTAVYQRGELRYVEENENHTRQENLAAGPNVSGNIVMFSLLAESDRAIFSSLFSPVLEGNLTVDNATSVLRHSELIHENDRKDFFRLLEQCHKENGWVENTIRFYTAKGRYEWLEVHLHEEYIPTAGETVISGTLINISGWKNEVNRWKEKANRDVLTGLYNREYFEQFASSSIEKDMLASGAIIFVDIDDFKNVNDTLGHMVGDDVICWFAKRILGAFRHTDIVARYGGDEFVIFVNGISREDIQKRLQQLSECFRYPYRNGTLEHAVSCSIGAAIFPDDGSSYLELLDHADSALYEAKRMGKNRFVLYHPGLDAASQQ